MKRDRESYEHKGDADGPSSEVERDLEQSAASEDVEGSDHQHSAEEAKRIKLQKKLKKLKQTYENRGKLYQEEVSPFSRLCQNSDCLLLRRHHLYQQNTASPGAHADSPLPLHLPSIATCSSLLYTTCALHPLWYLQKPQKLRHMLSQHGKISRLYLAPEGTDSSV